LLIIFVIFVLITSVYIFTIREIFKTNLI